MKVILHTGVHCTDEDRILKCLLRNAEAWRHEGVAIPGPSRYRRLLTDAVTQLLKATPVDNAREILLEAILQDDADQVQRLVLSHENFFAVPKVMFGGRRIYKKAEGRLRAFQKLFQGDEVELYLGLRDPATFLPAAFAATPHTDFETFLSSVDPMQFRWSDLVRRILADVPGMPITLWCNEDTPLIWGEVIRDMAGIEISRKITGAFDLFQQIVSPEGMRRFRAFLKESPAVNEAQKRRAMIAFLDKYGLDEAMEEELDLPGWDGAYVDMLTELYEDDMYEIGRMPGVRLIAP